MMMRVLRKTKGVGVEREDQVLDVITPLENVKNFQDEGEERDAAEDHRRKILNDCLQKQVAAITCWPDFFPGTLLQPATKAGLVFVVVELQKSMVLVG